MKKKNSMRIAGFICWMKEHRIISMRIAGFICWMKEHRIIRFIFGIVFFPFIWLSVWISKMIWKKTLDKKHIGHLENIDEGKIYKIKLEVNWYLVFAHTLNRYKRVFSKKWMEKSMYRHYVFAYQFPIVDKTKISLEHFINEYSDFFENPQQELMYTVKEANHYLKIRMKRRKRFGFEVFKNEEEVKVFFGKYHKMVIKEVPDLNYFMLLCQLDAQYGFIGMGRLNEEGSTVVRIGGEND